MAIIRILNATLVNEGKVFKADVEIENGVIAEISSGLPPIKPHTEVIDGSGLHLLPGLIDDQVHFREPGLTHKADLTTESRAAVAGDITSFMEMPNTVPNTFTQELLEAKYQRVAETSVANYSFFMGVSNDNLPEVLKTDGKRVCGVKVFMGSSTGNMLVDNPSTLDNLFKECPLLIAAHCEDEQTIQKNRADYPTRYGEEVPVKYHPVIRSAEACYRSSSVAAELATRHNTRLHILHISTARETSLFRNDVPLFEKRLTAEACIHHLWFTDADYESKGNLIKWNPAVKSAADREAVRKAVIDGRIDVIATDHAPHTLQEKDATYSKAPSGGPLVEHGLLALLEIAKQGVFSLEQIVQKTSHNVAEIFQIDKRGFIRKGYAADLVLVDLNGQTEVKRGEVRYKCGWSPFEGTTFSARITHTLVNGQWAYRDGIVNDDLRGARLNFYR